MIYFYLTSTFFRFSYLRISYIPHLSILSNFYCIFQSFYRTNFYRPFSIKNFHLFYAFPTLTQLVNFYPLFLSTFLNCMCQIMGWSNFHSYRKLFFIHFLLLEYVWMAIIWRNFPNQLSKFKKAKDLYLFDFWPFGCDKFFQPWNIFLEQIL